MDKFCPVKLVAFSANIKTERERAAFLGYIETKKYNDRNILKRSECKTYKTVQKQLKKHTTLM